MPRLSVIVDLFSRIAIVAIALLMVTTAADARSRYKRNFSAYTVTCDDHRYAQCAKAKVYKAKKQYAKKARVVRHYAANKYRAKKRFVAPRPKIAKTMLSARRSTPAPIDPQPTSEKAVALVAEARRWIGARAYQLGVRPTLWCAAAVNKWLANIGHRGTGSDLAASFASYGRRISEPQVGAIAVMSRGRRGGHVGVVVGVTKAGGVIVISGNHGNRVAQSVYPRGRIYAYVVPATNS